MNGEVVLFVGWSLSEVLLYVYLDKRKKKQP